MNFKPNTGVPLVTRDFPYILDGKEQPKLIKQVFVTPEGYFPRMSDITALYSRSRREIEGRRMKYRSPKFDGWYVIDNPTLLEVEKAVDNVNRLYTIVNEDSDHCPLCNLIDDELFKEQCWVISTVHSCDSEEESYEEIKVLYLYDKVEYIVTMGDWGAGTRPHKEIK